MGYDDCDFSLSKHKTENIFFMLLMEGKSGATNFAYTIIKS